MIINVLFETISEIKNIENIENNKEMYNRQVIDILNSSDAITKSIKGINYKYKEETGNVTPHLNITWIDDDYDMKFKGYSIAILNSRYPGKIFLNINNWRRLRKPHHSAWIEHYGKNRALKVYRKYVINHELGHVLGAKHDDFDVSPSTKSCHLMEQQTFAPKRNCKPSYKVHKNTIKIIEKSSKLG